MVCHVFHFLITLFYPFLADSDGGNHGVEAVAGVVINDIPQC